MKTFTCNFGSGVACAIKVADSPPTQGQSHIRECTWTGKPNRTTLRPYVAWMNQVNTQLANEWGISLMHVFQTAPNTVESWVYVPGKPARRITKSKMPPTHE